MQYIGPTLSTLTVKFSFYFTSKCKTIWEENWTIYQSHLGLFTRHPFFSCSCYQIVSLGCQCITWNSVAKNFSFHCGQDLNSQMFWPSETCRSGMGDRNTHTHKKKKKTAKKKTTNKWALLEVACHSGTHDGCLIILALGTKLNWHFQGTGRSLARWQSHWLQCTLSQW